jgi:glutathione peroxidase-family protein
MSIIDSLNSKLKIVLRREEKSGNFRKFLARKLEGIVRRFEYREIPAQKENSVFSGEMAAIA